MCVTFGLLINEIQKLTQNEMLELNGEEMDHLSVIVLRNHENDILKRFEHNKRFSKKKQLVRIV